MSELPQLEYDLEIAKEELRKKYFASKSIPKKRKFDLGINIKEEEITKRNTKKIDYNDKKSRVKKENNLVKNMKSKKNQEKEPKYNTSRKQSSNDKSDPQQDKLMILENEKKEDVFEKKINKKIKV